MAFPGSWWRDALRDWQTDQSHAGSFGNCGGNLVLPSTDIATIERGKCRPDLDSVLLHCGVLPHEVSRRRRMRRTFAPQPLGGGTFAGDRARHKVDRTGL